jgi:hypothetical protein
MIRLKREQEARDEGLPDWRRPVPVKPAGRRVGQSADGDARRPPEGGPPADPAAPTPGG